MSNRNRVKVCVLSVLFLLVIHRLPNIPAILKKYKNQLRTHLVIYSWWWNKLNTRYIESQLQFVNAHKKYSG